MVLVKCCIDIQYCMILIWCWNAQSKRVKGGEGDFFLLLVLTSSNEAQRFQILGRSNGVLTASILNVDQEASTLVESIFIAFTCTTWQRTRRHGWFFLPYCTTNGTLFGPPRAHTIHSNVSCHQETLEIVGEVKRRVTVKTWPKKPLLIFFQYLNIFMLKTRRALHAATRIISYLTRTHAKMQTSSTFANIISKKSSAYSFFVALRSRQIFRFGNLLKIQTSSWLKSFVKF